MPREHGWTEKGRREGGDGREADRGSQFQRGEGGETEMWSTRAEMVQKEKDVRAPEIGVLSVWWQLEDEDAEPLRTCLSVSGIS